MKALTFGALLILSRAHADGEKCKVNGGGSQQLRSCMEAHCKAKNGCDDAATSARQQSDAAAGQVAQQYGGSTATSKPAKAIAGAERDSSGFYTKALGDCDKQFKDECQQKCKPDQAKPEDKSRISEELKTCESDIKKTKDTLNAGKAGVDKAEKGSEDTGKESGGKGGEPPKPPEAPKGDDKKEDKPTTPTTASTPATSDAGSSGQQAPARTGDPLSTASTSGGSCTTEAEALQTQCQDKMKTACASGTSTLCTQFTNRYCGTNGASGGGEGPDDVKSGSGVSDQFCKNQTARTFCAAGGRDSCDSCRALKNLSPLPAEQQDASCGIDPASLPNLQRNGSNAVLPASAGGGGGGGGGSSGGGSSAVNAKVETKAVTESMFDKIKSAMGMDAGGGGGGGGSGGSGGGDGGDHTVADFLAGYNVIGKSPGTARGPAAEAEAMTTAATDIQPRGPGPNVFNIVTEVIGARCAADKQNNCPPRK